MTAAEVDSGAGAWACNPDTTSAKECDTTTAYWEKFIHPQAPMGEDLQVTYSAGVANLDTMVLSLAKLRKLAESWSSPDSTQNYFGYNKSMFATQYDYFHQASGTDRRYGDEDFTTGNFLLYQNTTGFVDSVALDHTDLVIRRRAEVDSVCYCNTPGTPPSALDTSDDGEPTTSGGYHIAHNGVKICLEDAAPANWYTTEGSIFSIAIHETEHMLDLSVQSRAIPDVWAKEWIAKTSEFMIGQEPSLSFGYDAPYGASIYAHGASDAGNPERRIDDAAYVWKYPLWLLWGSYLVMQFDEGTPTSFGDDLLFRFLTEDHSGGKSHQSMWGLARTLESSDYNAYPYLHHDIFPSYIDTDEERGNERLKRIFSNHAVAKWTNAADYGDGRYGYSSSYVPTDHTPLFRNFDSGAKSTYSVPPKLWVGSSHVGSDTTVGDYWTDAIGTADTTHIALYGWSSDYWSFQAKSELDDGDCHELVVNIHPDTTMTFNSSSEYSYDLRAHLIAYSVTSHDSLWAMGSDVQYITELEVDTAQDSVVSVRVPCFGTLNKAATIVLSMTEFEPSLTVNNIPGTGDYRKLPRWEYNVTYRVEDTGEGGYVSVPTWKNAVCLEGDVDVAGLLTIEPGTLVGVADDDSGDPGTGIKLTASQGADLRGTSSNPIVFRTLKATPTSSDWDGLRFESHASVVHYDVNNAVIANADYAITGPAGDDSLTVQDTAIENCEGGISHTSGTGVVVLRDVTFSDITNSAVSYYGNNSNSVIEGVVVDNAFSGIEIAGSTALSLESSSVGNSDYGIDIVNASVTTNDLTADTIDEWGFRINGVAPTIYNSRAHDAKWGFYITGGDGADAILDSVKTHDNSKGIKIDAGPDVKIRDAEIYGNTVGLDIYGGGSIADLGVTGTDPGNNNFKKGASANSTNILWFSEFVGASINAEENWWGATTPASIGGSFTIAGNGTVDYSPYKSSQISLRQGQVALRSGLRQNAPNPFNPVTRISFTTSTDAHVRLDIFDVRGRLVATVLDEPAKAGEHEVFWHGTDRNGMPVNSGVYFYTLSADGKRESKRMLLLK